MKKYIKPDAVIETFLLSQSIATCGWDMNLKDKESCYALGDEDLGMHPVKLFVHKSICDATEDEVGEDYCYEAGTGAWGLFNS